MSVHMLPLKSKMAERDLINGNRFTEKDWYHFCSAPFSLIKPHGATRDSLCLCVCSIPCRPMYVIAIKALVCFKWRACQMAEFCAAANEMCNFMRCLVKCAAYGEVWKWAGFKLSLKIYFFYVFITVSSLITLFYTIDTFEERSESVLRYPR